MAVPTNVNAGDTILASQQNDLVAYSVPQNMIAIWHGLIANIPTGWILCDGAEGSGTPDLRDRFIQGASAATEAGGTGGSATHTLSAGEIPAHKHYIFGGGGGVSSGMQAPAGSDHAQIDFTENTGGGGAHQNEPAYYDVLFIMKT